YSTSPYVSSTACICPFFLHPPSTPTSPLFPYTTLFRSTPTVFPRFSRIWVTKRWFTGLSSATRIRKPSAAGDGSRRESRAGWSRSEEHTSELQSRENLVCRLLLEKKKKQKSKLQSAQ